MPLDEVLGNEPIDPKVPQGQGKDENVTITKSEFDRMNRELTETRQSERYWAGRASGAPATEQVVEEPTEDASEFYDADAQGLATDDTPEKLVEDFASKGASALSSRGFITKADAQKLAADTALKVTRELIGRERVKITTDAQIFEKFPELKDKNSDLWKEAAVNFQAAVAMDKNALKTPAALYLAAKAASETLKARAATARRTQEDDEPESDRQHRAASQDSRTRGGSIVESDDDMMGSEAKAVARAMGLSAEEFTASKKELAAGGRRKR
jgi:hypothetical protein